MINILACFIFMVPELDRFLKVSVNLVVIDKAFPFHWISR